MLAVIGAVGGGGGHRAPAGKDCGYLSLASDGFDGLFDMVG